ncbi:MAG: hypothetical protein IJ353_07280 [Lachnospiraceae bacterium]|nr:hypothetical protein [Lachnospiraceae bacterium]
MAVGYLLAKAGDKFYVMPEKEYEKNKSDYLKSFGNCQKNLNECIVDCSLESADILPINVSLEMYDYKVEYDNKSIKKIVTNENGKLQTKGKKVYLYACFNKNYDGEEYIVVNPINLSKNTLSGNKKNFSKKPEKNDLFLCCLYLNEKGNLYIGAAKYIGKNMAYFTKNMSMAVKTENKKSMSKEIKGEAFYKDTQGNDLRFGVLSGFFLANERYNTISEAIIDDRFYFPVYLMDDSLANTWLNYCGINADNNTDKASYKILVAYYIDDTTKEITKVVDARDISDKIIDKKTDCYIPWQKCQFAEKIKKDKGNKTNALQLKIKRDKDTVVNAELIGKVKYYTGEDKVAQKRINSIWANNEAYLPINPNSEYFWFQLVKIGNENNEIKYEVLDMKETKEQVGTILKDGFEESNNGRIYYSLLDPETGKPQPDFLLAEVKRTTPGAEEKTYGWTWTKPCNEPWEVDIKYKNFLDRAVEISSYYTRYEKKWAAYNNKKYNKYEPVRFLIEKNPNIKVDIQSNTVDLCALVRIDKICDAENVRPYYICCSFQTNEGKKNNSDKANCVAFSKYVEENKDDYIIRFFSDWWIYFFAAHTNAEKLFEDKKSRKRENNIAKQLKKIFLKGMDFSRKFDASFGENYKDISFEQWAADIPKEYIKEFDKKDKKEQDEFKEWMLQSILNLHTYFSYDLVRSFKEEPECKGNFNTYLGVEEAELDTLLELVWRREVILNSAESLTKRVEEIKKKVCDIEIKEGKTFADFAYDKTTLGKWNTVCKYALETDENLVTEEHFKTLANFILDLKNKPNKAISEIIFKPIPTSKGKADPNLNEALFYSLIAAKPELSLKLVDEKVFNTQENLRVCITNAKAPEHVFTRMPVCITGIEVVATWKMPDSEKVQETKWKTDFDSTENTKIKAGEARVFNLSLKALENEKIWATATEITFSFKIYYSGDYYIDENVHSIELAKDGKNLYISEIATWNRNEILDCAVASDSSKNKYLDRFLDGTNFFGRQDEVIQIADWVNSQEKHFCISGQKQCGKSSLSGYVFDGEKYTIIEEKLYQADKFTQKRFLCKNYSKPLVITYPTISDMCKKYTLENVTGRMRWAIVKSLVEFIKENYKDALEEDEELAGLTQRYITVELTKEQVKNIAQLLKLNKYSGGDIRIFTNKDTFDGMNQEDFKEWMNTFRDVMKRKYGITYKVIVVIDEFTDLCNQILDANLPKRERETIFNEILVNAFSSDIYVLAIGHENMRLMLNEIITSHNGLIKQDSILLKDLNEPDVKALLCCAFNLNEINELFSDAVFNKIMNISGGSVKVLKVILRKVYDKYYAGKLGDCITELDIIEGTNAVITEAITNSGTIIDGLFDPFLQENKDEKAINESIVAYLLAIAKNMLQDGKCNSEETRRSNLNVQITEGLHKGRYLFDLLLEREIIIRQGNQVKIKVGALAYYLLALAEKRNEMEGNYD